MNEQELQQSLAAQLGEQVTVEKGNNNTFLIWVNTDLKYNERVDLTNKLIKFSGGYKVSDTMICKFNAVK